MLGKIPEQPPTGKDSASELEGAGCPGSLKTGFHMPERRNSSSSQERPPTVLAFHDGNQRAELVAQAEMLARYPANIREQITELLRILAAKPGEAENGVR
jgi:hypothetical protein